MDAPVRAFVVEKWKRDKTDAETQKIILTDEKDIHLTKWHVFFFILLLYLLLLLQCLLWLPVSWYWFFFLLFLNHFFPSSLFKIERIWWPYKACNYLCAMFDYWCAVTVLGVLFAPRVMTVWIMIPSSQIPFHQPGVIFHIFFFADARPKCHGYIKYFL